MRSPRQARLALSGAADRAAALGASDQAVSYLEQALAITSDPRTARRCSTEPRALRPLRHGRMPNATPRRRCRPIASSATAPARRGIGPARQDTHRRRRGARAPEVLEATLTEAEEVGDEPTWPRRLHIWRVPKCDRERRSGRRDGGSLAGNRGTAQPGADRGRGVHQQGLRAGHARPAPGEHRARTAPPSSSAKSSATRGRSRCACETISPRRSSTMSRPKPRGCSPRHSSSPREIGDRGMYFWLAGTLAGALHEEGRDWDAHEILMREALRVRHPARRPGAAAHVLGTLYCDIARRGSRRTAAADSRDPRRDHGSRRAVHGQMVPRATARSSRAIWRLRIPRHSRQPNS